jgi:GxxExxY protein
MLNTTQNNAENKYNRRKVRKLLYEKESYLIRGACFDLYKELGNGHKETVYQKGLAKLLEDKNLVVEREKRIPVTINGESLGNYTPDFVINDNILIETKAKSHTTIQDKKQFWHYLKATDYKLGFLVNFGKPGGVEIIRRVYDTAREKL